VIAKDCHIGLNMRVELACSDERKAGCQERKQMEKHSTRIIAEEAFILFFIVFASLEDAEPVLHVKGELVD
jgi:hypothetical protein